MLSKIKIKLKSEFFKDSFWALIGNIVFRGSALLATILLAQILQKDTYGEFNSLKNTLTTLAVFTTFGLGYTSTKFVANSISAGNNPSFVIKKVYNVAFVFSVIIAFLLFVFADYVSVFYYNNNHFAEEIRILSFFNVLLAFTTAQNGIMAGLKIFKKLTYVNGCMGVITLITMPLLSHYYNIIGACISLVVIQLFNCIVNHFIIQKELQSIESTKKDATKYNFILIYSLPLTLIEAVYSVALWMNYFLIQKHFKYGEVALYSTAMQWYMLLLFIPLILKNVLLSHFSGSDSSEGGSLFKNAMLISFMSTIVPAVVILLSSSLVQKLYGNSFVGLAPVIRIAALIPLFSSVMSVLEQYYFSKSRNWTVFLVSLVKDGGTVILFWYFIKFQKIHDAAFYLILSYLLLNILALLIYSVIYYRNYSGRNKTGEILKTIS